MGGEQDEAAPNTGESEDTPETGKSEDAGRGNEAGDRGGEARGPTHLQPLGSQPERMERPEDGERVNLGLRLPHAPAEARNETQDARDGKQVEDLTQVPRQGVEAEGEHDEAALNPGGSEDAVKGNAAEAPQVHRPSGVLPVERIERQEDAERAGNMEDAETAWNVLSELQLPRAPARPHRRHEARGRRGTSPSLL